jgi:signal transduction histidine kinase
VAGRLFALGLAIPLLGRRTHPLATFAVISAVALAQVLAGARTPGDAAVLVALYTVASTQPTGRLMIAAVVVEAGIVLAVIQWSNGTGLPIFTGLNAMAIAASVIGINARNRRALVDSLRERAARAEHQRDQQAQLAAAAERSRIAREMHDIVAHNVSVMIALADGAAFAVADSPVRALTAMENVARTGREALTEMRRLLGVLRAETETGTRAPQPGLDELESLVGQVRAAGLAVTLLVEGDSWTSLPPGLQLTAYRIVQEALTNTLKHAGPDASACVRLSVQDEALELDVSDTGAGRAVGPIREGGGLRGMRERAAVYGGEVEAGAEETGGWRVTTRLSALAGAVT